ncbi:hypothetical protein L4174_020460 [Photobacterium sp. CCB-ST2H9]|uniref:hypothetical protein n=1 Tax=unclassified Photobacterium TaxID=2628852 RepID=UPI0020045942|nr:hypothetical protein [Photobacterium sp. CCB-ST2H9]UTM59088.1 hypothetical protein L4174_020460 [Photobacterium sp. CCB-ST2H9]
MKRSLLASLLFLFSVNASAEIETGPRIATLYPTGFYHDAGDGLYIEFQPGSLPGCNQDKGARLSKQNPNYKELYSLLLTMMATKNFQGNLRFEQTENTGWWKCSIKGIFAFPKS